jgi:hypothetical protein
VSPEQKQNTDFEQRLLGQLRAVVAERGVAEAATGVAGTTAATPAWRRPSPRLALAGAGTLAAIVAGILVLSSGPTAEPAAAEVLRHTAVVAADGPTGSTPGPGQFLYMKTKSLELQGWIPGEATVGGGTLSQNGAFNALVPTEREAWMSAAEPSRNRLVIGAPQFLSSAEESRWAAAGSPLPGPFGEEGERGVVDGVAKEGQGFVDTAALPTEPKALRLAIEGGQASGTGQVISELWDILDKPNTTPALRAAVFGALAELPGIELNHDAKDLVGRPGYALSHESEGSSSYGEHQPGLRVEYIFDPETSAILGRREIIADPEKLSWARGIPAGTVRREVAYLQSGLVDSTAARPE